MNLYGEDKEKIKQIVLLLKESENILFITGAGISADSGLPTYRGVGGLYNQETTEEGIPIETVLAAETLQRQPELTWKYLSQIETKCRQAKFNRGHAVMAEMEKHFPRVWILTQNIDGLHHAAGSRKVIDIHGDMHKIFCSRCGWQKTVKDYSEIKIPPLCPQCQQIARPQVVFFGELLPEDKLRTLGEELKVGFDLYFSVGTTSVFPYISQPIIDAKLRRRPTVEINPACTEISDIVEIKLRLKAATAMDAIWQEYLKHAIN